MKHVKGFSHFLYMSKRSVFDIMPQFECPEVDLFIFISAWATLHCLGVTFGNAIKFVAVEKYIDCADLRVHFDEEGKKTLEKEKNKSH